MSIISKVLLCLACITTLSYDSGSQIAATEAEEQIYYTESDAIDLAKLLYAECGGVSSQTEQACVAWCVLNRVDTYNSSIHDVVRAPYQFAFYESAEVREDLYQLALDVLQRWNDEKNGADNVGRVLPIEYIYFSGDGTHNYFRTEENIIWDYTLESPYEN